MIINLPARFLRRALFAALFLLLLSVPCLAQQDGLVISGTHQNQSGSAPPFYYRTSVTEAAVRRNADGSVDFAGCMTMVVIGSGSCPNPPAYDLSYTLYSDGLPVASGAQTFPLNSGSGNFQIHFPAGTVPAGTQLDIVAHFERIPSTACQSTSGMKWTLGLDSRLGTESSGAEHNQGQTVTRYGVGQLPANTCNMPPPPVVCQTIMGVSASPSAVGFGGSTAISWTTSNATSVDVVDLATGQTIASGLPANGSLAVTPPSSRSYRVVAHGSCADVTADVPVTVCPSAAASSFTPSPSSINAGGNSTLTWNVPGASSVTISGVGTFGPSGSTVVSPSSTTTYTLTASGDAGCAPITLQTTVDVVACPDAATSSFSSSPGTIALGGSSTLTWNVPNATSVTISGVGTFGASGSVAVSPSSSTTYTLTASGAGACAAIQLQATVNVTPCPTVAGSSFSSSPSSIVPGGSSTLTWNVPNATSVTISGVPGTFGATGSVSVSPGSTTTYTLTATGAGACASIQLQATVNVAACPTAAGSSFSSSPGTIFVGQSSTLTWNVPNATSVTIAGVPGTFGATGSVSVSPSSTTTYTLTAAGPGTCSAVQLQATVNVTPCPTVAGSTFTATPSSSVAGQSVTLSWNVPNATSVTISGVAGTFSATGSVTVNPTSTTTYTLTATGGGTCASIQLQRTVNVTPCPTVAGSSFSSSPSTINQGQSTTLSWNVPNATSVTIAGVGTFGASGSVSVTPSASTTYTLTANGASGCAAINLTATVTVNPLPGVPMVGPQGQPLAVGPTDSNDDYTNMTATSGVAAPFGGTTTAGGVVTFTNTAFNNSSSAQSMAFTARVIPAGFTVDCSSDGGATWTNLNTGSLTGTAPGGATYTLLVRVTYPAGLNVLTPYAVVMRLSNTGNSSAFNETINRLYMGFIRVDKTQAVTNSTGVGGATQPVKGAVIRYSLAYSNVTPAATGTGNVELFATNLTLTEDGSAPPNNWASYTDHVAGSATDTRGGTITGDTAGSTLIKDVIPRLDPAQSGVFSYSRKIR